MRDSAEPLGPTRRSLRPFRPSTLSSGSSAPAAWASASPSVGGRGPRGSVVAPFRAAASGLRFPAGRAACGPRSSGHRAPAPTGPLRPATAVDAGGSAVGERVRPARGTSRCVTRARSPAGSRRAATVLRGDRARGGGWESAGERRVRQTVREEERISEGSGVTGRVGACQSRGLA